VTGGVGRRQIQGRVCAVGGRVIEDKKKEKERNGGRFEETA